MNQIKESIPEILYLAIDESLTFGAWVTDETDDICVKLDCYLVLNDNFEKSLRNIIEVHCDRLFRNNTNKKLVFKKLSEVYNALKRQLEWSFKIKDTYRALYYTKFVYFMIVTLARNERKYLQKEGGKISNGMWNKEKIALGKKICGFFNGIIKDNKWNDANMKQDVVACVSAIEIDLISLPSLIEHDNDNLDIEDPVKTLVHAIEVLKRLPETKTITYPASYWLAKAYRHLAMANIKASRHHNALIFLHISSVYLRYLKGEIYTELAEERLRGFAELYKTLGNNAKAKIYIEGTKYTNNSIAGYYNDPEEKELEELKLRMCLVRHGERDSDENKKFGFTPLTTIKGNKQQSAILGSLKRIIESSYSNIVIVSSEQLEKDAQYFSKELQSSFKSQGYEIEIIVKSEWNPINVGSFRGLNEKTASIEYPGEYDILTDYRNGARCGYDLGFPNGVCSENCVNSHSS